jgi:ABC-type branched-subunit amino acid transport system substrate-binding protein
LEALDHAGVDCPVFLPWVPGLELAEYPARSSGPVIQVSPFRPPRDCGPYLKMVRSAVRSHGARPTAAMVYAFDAANLVIEALRNGADGRVELRQRLAELSGTTGASGPILWDNGGGNTAEPVVTALP